jgi:sodium transport system permease protein
MRRATVRLIARRELRDLLRDRRTVLLILGLPVVLYPVFGLIGIVFALTMLDQKIVVGVAGMDQLPTVRAHPEALVAGGLWLAECDRRLDDPPLIADGQFLPRYLRSEADLAAVVVRPLEGDGKDALAARRVDALLIVPPDFAEKLRRGEKPAVTVLGRDGDETSKLAARRLAGVVGRWQQTFKEVRFARHGLPPDFDEPFKVSDELEERQPAAKAADELRDALVRFFPFLLVMWTMAGALHPAIDLTAGEKERGTMETLLISPAERGEIVAGKFLAVWLFACLAAVWNLLWMGGGAVVLGWLLPFPIVSYAGLAWAALFALPLAALFSAIAIGLGAFARSAKEGQHYLMPLLLLTLPLTLWSMTPGLKLTPALSLVPVTGLALLLRQLMSVGGEPASPLAWAGVVVSLAACVALALAWASWQFRREGVLFREAERSRSGGWLRSLFGKRR